jgi:hypothetical protein
VKPVPDLFTAPSVDDKGYEDFGLDTPESTVVEKSNSETAESSSTTEPEPDETTLAIADLVRSPFEIRENVIYEPPRALAEDA